jgi:HD superfamily phosphodiesterase
VSIIDPPATALAAEVRRLLDQCAPVVAAHSERSYQFAAAFAATDSVKLDDEVLYLGTVLHDVGLSPAAEGSERFEVRGANLVRALLLDHGMERDRIANVWDCIAMHASTPLARHKSLEAPGTRCWSRSCWHFPASVRMRSLTSSAPRREQ